MTIFLNTKFTEVSKENNTKQLSPKLEKCMAAI